MEEFGRLLPLLIIWGIYWLISRRGEKHQEEPPATRKDKGSWLPPETLELPPVGYEAPEERFRPEPVYYHAPAKQERQTPVSMPAPAAACRDIRTAARCRARVSRRMLQRMFVWSEILAPPVGLREGEERRP